MAYVLGKFKPESEDESRIFGAVRNYRDHLLVSHDTTSGNVFVAKCLGNGEGAEVYKFEEFTKDRNELIKKLGDLVVPANVHAHLLPWFKSEEFPMTLDNGEQGHLSFVHFPDIILIPVRSRE